VSIFVSVLAESEIPLQNICRCASNAGCKISCKEVDCEFEITVE
jgi:hypothetical protein